MLKELGEKEEGLERRELCINFACLGCDEGFHMEILSRHLKS
jgi:hypothetical protein